MWHQDVAIVDPYIIPMMNKIRLILLHLVWLNPNIEIVEVEAPTSELETVSLMIQAVKVPARHQKLVRVQVTNNVFERHQLIFEPQLANEKYFVGTRGLGFS